MAGAHDIIAVNRADAVVLTESGTILVPSMWIDDEGDGCEPGEALACIVQRPDGLWAVVDMRDFEEVSVQ